MPLGQASKTSALTIAGTPTVPTATLDLRTGGLIVSYTSGGGTLKDNLTKLVGVARGIQDPDTGLSPYTGKGITSSSAATNNTTAQFDKFAVGVVNNSDLNDLSAPYDATNKFMGQTVGLQTFDGKSGFTLAQGQ